MSEGSDTQLDEGLRREYTDERDMDRFWEVARLEREPARQWWYIPAIVALIIVSIPWFGAANTGAEDEYGFVSIQYGPINWEAVYLGLPVWIWIPLGCAFGLSMLTAFAILRFWGDGESDSD